MDRNYFVQSRREFSILEDKTKKIFWIFIILHVVLWTLAPTWTRFNLPMDSVEGTIWAQKLVFGYDKAPLLNAWVTAFVIWLFGYVDWAIYFISQISVAICFIALWQLAKKILLPVYALLAVMILEGFQYYNIGAIDFDDNVLQLPLWALCCLFFYRALREKQLKDWGWLGFFASLAMLAKYYAVLLFLSMLIFLCRRENRHYFREKGIYLAVSIFLAMMMPHVIWLFQNDFLTIHYVFRRIGDLPTWNSHVVNPLLFLRDEAYALIVPSLLFALLFFGSGYHATKKLSLLDRHFLFYLSFLPFLLALFISILTGIKLHIMWGSALFSLWGILFIGLFQPKLTPAKIYRFFSVMLLLFFTAWAGYLLSIHRAQNHSSAHFPGRIIAHSLVESWNQRYHQPLAYVIGSRWLAGNLSFYSSFHPVVLIDGDLRLTRWIDLFDLYRKGALLIWDMSKFGNTIPEEYKHFITHQNFSAEVKTFSWQMAADEHPIKIGILFLPPRVNHNDTT